YFAQGTPSLFYGESYVTGQADYHYATPLALAVLALAPPAAQRSGPLAVLLAARAATTKSEGAAYVLAATLVAAAWWAACQWRGPQRARGRAPVTAAGRV